MAKHVCVSYKSNLAFTCWLTTGGNWIGSTSCGTQIALVSASGRGPLRGGGCYINNHLRVSRRFDNDNLYDIYKYVKSLVYK
jgi:hypothetical protein